VKAALGEYRPKLADYFARNNGYSDKELAEHLGVSEKRLAELLEWYARRELGMKILDCVKRNGMRAVLTRNSEPRKPPTLSGAF